MRSRKAIHSERLLHGAENASAAENPSEIVIRKQ